MLVKMRLSRNSFPILNTINATHRRPEGYIDSKPWIWGGAASLMGNSRCQLSEDDS